MSIVEVNQLSKSYGKVEALKSLNFSVKNKEKVALLGCNGAGKSTLLSLLMGLKKPTSGDCFIFGKNPDHKDNRHNVSYLPQQLSYPEHIKVKEVLSTVSSHFPKKNIKGLIKDLGLSDLLNRQSYNLSGGERRKVGVALSLLRDPKLLIMDEPTANIDLLGKNKIYDTIEEYLKNNECGFIFSSHEMHEVERLAHRVIVLNHGEIIANGSVQEIKNMFGLKRVSFISDFKNFNFSDFEKYEITDGNIHTIFAKNSDEAIKSLFSQSHDFKDLMIFETSLEEIFVNLWADKKDASL